MSGAEQSRLAEDRARGIPWKTWGPYLSERQCEDVKEYYHYLDSTPTHSYMKYLYKYPQSAYPYADLVNTNRERSAHEPEYELLDTGAFAGDRYFDVFVEYAEKRTRGYPHPDHGSQSRRRTGVDPRPANPVVTQHVVVEHERAAQAGLGGEPRRPE